MVRSVRVLIREMLITDANEAVRDIQAEVSKQPILPIILPCLRGEEALKPSVELRGVGVLERGFILGALLVVPTAGLSDLRRRSPTSHMDFHLRDSESPSGVPTPIAAFKS